MKAIGYIRVSTGRQERGTSLASQQRDIEAHCNTQGWDLVEIRSEVESAGVRAGSLFSWDHRPELLAVLESAPTIDHVVVAAFDRLSRDHASLTILKRLLLRDGVSLVSAREQTEDSATSRLLESQLALFAEFERDMINERLRLGKARRKAQGRHVHGRVPFGYVSHGGKLTEHAGESPAVRQIFLRRAEGETIASIVRQLNDDSVGTRRGGKWSPSTVIGILRNRAYLGERYAVRRAHPQIIHTRTWNRANKRSSK